MCNSCVEEIKIEELINIQTCRKIDMDIYNSLPENAMLKVKPELFCIWDFVENNKLGFDIYKMTKGSTKEPYWYCEKCDESYDNYVHKKVADRGCPYCAGYRVGKSNSLATIHPEIINEWHPTLNGDRTPYNYTYGSGEIIWWQCSSDNNHIWDTSINNRHNGTGCPYCNKNNPKTLKGYNDLWTTHPHVAKLLIDKEIGYKFSYGNSHMKVKWKCESCTHINTNTINEICNNLKCKKCSDTLSLGEKIIYSLLDNKNIEFTHEVSFKWSNNKRYDFYLSKHNTIIEVHGEQHYVQTNRKNTRTLEEEQDNDKHKYETAMQNGIENYIVIDARYSDFEFIINKILNSDLTSLITINRKEIEQLDISYNLLTVKTWGLWNDGLGVMEISRQLKISKSTIKRYLKLGNSLKKCVYNVNDKYKNMKVSILELDLKGNIIARYDSLISAKNLEPKNSLQLTVYPFNNIRQTKNHIWVYEKEYEENKPIFEKELYKFRLKTNVCQIDKNNNLLSVFNNVVDASLKTSIDYFNILASCKGKRKTSGGFRWMYLEDYNDMIKEKQLTD